MLNSVQGADLHLGFIANDEGQTVAGPFSRLDLQVDAREDISPRARDLRVVEGRANLVQSLILRLKTAQGELRRLGHPGYGSRHHDLIGEPNVDSNRNLLKLRILECLKQEPRLQRVVKLEVKALGRGENRDKVKVEMTLEMKGLSDPFSFVLPFNFAGPFE